MSLKPSNKKGIFITIIKILKLILVKKLSIIEIPVIAPEAFLIRLLVPVNTIFSPNSELMESICFAQAIKELTRMHAEFKETYKNSDEFANGMANDYVDLYRSTNDCE